MSDLKKMTPFPKDFEFNKITSGMHNAANAMRAYAKLDMKATIFMLRQLDKKFFPKEKTRAAHRTISNRKWAGHKQNKPKHYWNRKKRARMGWTV